MTAGGRVLAVTAHAPTLREAVDAAYKGVDSIDFEGKTFRRDIAHRYCDPYSSPSKLLTIVAGRFPPQNQNI